MGGIRAPLNPVPEDGVAGMDDLADPGCDALVYDLESAAGRAPDLSRRLRGEQPRILRHKTRPSRNGALAWGEGFADAWSLLASRLQCGESPQAGSVARRDHQETQSHAQLLRRHPVRVALPYMRCG